MASSDSVSPAEFLETYGPTLFVVSGVLFGVAAGLVVVEIVAGAERLSMLVGEAFIAAGWVAGLFGLLGLYRGLADRSRWLARAGAVFAVLGAATFTVMAVAAIVFYMGLAEGELTAYVPFFLPGVFIGSILAFISFSIATLRSDAPSRAVGIGLLVPPAIVILNILIWADAPLAHLAINSGLALIFSVLGYLIRSEPERNE